MRTLRGRKIPLISGFFAFVFASAVGAQEAKVNVVFVNGINTTREGAAAARVRIKEILTVSRNHPSPDKKEFFVTGVWNPIGWTGTQKALDSEAYEDVTELFILKTAEENYADDFQQIAAPHNASTPISMDAAKRIDAFIQRDNLLPGRNYLEEEGFITAEHMAATKSAILDIVDRIKANEISIVVAHSQGNLLANLAYASFASEPGNDVFKAVRIVNVGNTSEFSLSNLNFTHEKDAFLYSGLSCPQPSLERLPFTSRWTRTTPRCPDNGRCDFTIADAPLGSPSSSNCPNHYFVETYLSTTTVPVSNSQGIAFTSGAIQFSDRFEDFVYAAANSLAISNALPITVSLNADPATITSGENSTLIWSSTNATSCSASSSPSSGAWTGSKNLTGNINVLPTVTTTYTLTCTGDSEPVSDSVTVTVTAQNPVPTVTISANPIFITPGQSSTLAWSSTNATSCTASGAWTGSRTTDGTEIVSPATPSTYSLTCNGAGGSGNDSVTVSVSEQAVTAPRIVRVSVTTDNKEWNGANVYGTSISANGRFVAFNANAFNLAGDTNSVIDVFVRDRDTDTDGIFDEPGAVDIALLSRNSSGELGNGSSRLTAISANGRFVAFRSNATNLVTGDNNSLEDIFVRDRDTDGDGIFDEPGAIATILVSRNANGVIGNSFSNGGPSISANGRFVTFRSSATNLVSDDTNGQADIFVHDLDTDADGIFDEPGAVATILISRNTNGEIGNSSSHDPSISANGRFVVFGTLSNNLAPGCRFVVRDRDTDADGVLDEPGAVATTCVGLSTSGELDNEGGGIGSISADGRFVAFMSGGTNLASDDTNGKADVFVRDRDTDGDGVFDEPGAVSTMLLSRSSAGDVGNNDSGNVGLPGPNLSISADGRFVVFDSQASNLVPGDTNGTVDIFVRDRDADTDGIFDEPGAVATTLISRDSAGSLGNALSVFPAISADGRFIAFGSDASNLVSNDTNTDTDAFVVDRTQVPSD